MSRAPAARWLVGVARAYKNCTQPKK